MLELLTNCQLFSPIDLGPRHILIGGSSILWIGEKIPQLDSSLDVRVSNMDGLIVTPGLIDGHAHLTGGGGESGFSSRVPPMPLSSFTRAGVTTAVGVLGTDDLVRTTGSLVAQARNLCELGLTAYCHTGGYHVPPTTLTGSVRGDIVHIDRVIGVGELAISDHRSSQPTLDELLRIAADTHVAGMMANKAGIVHLHLGDGEQGLEMVSQALDRAEIPARVYNPTHVNRRKRLFDQAVQLAMRGCTIDVTCMPGQPGDDEWSAEQAILRYFASGAPVDKITASSDGGGCIPEFDSEGRISHMAVGDPMLLFQCLQNLLDGGAPLERILPVFTRNVASLLRLPKKGRIDTGCDADLLVIDDSGQHWGTMALGIWQFRNGELLQRGQFEPASTTLPGFSN